MTYEAAAAVCADGLTSKTFEERSAGPQKTVDAWRRDVVDALRDAKVGDATARKGHPVTKELAGRYHALAKALSPDSKTGATAVPWSSPADLDSLLDGKVKGFEDFGGYSDRERPMWAYLKKKDLAYEADWQHTTAASFVQTVKKDGKDQKVVRYAEADSIPYVVRRGTFQPRMGSYVKVTANGRSTYARVLESGPVEEGTEASLKVFESLGFPAVTPNRSPVSTLKFEPIGTPPSGALNTTFEAGYLSNEEIQLAGGLIEGGGVGHVGTHQELFDAMTKKYGDQAREVAKAQGVTFPPDMKPTPKKPAAAAPSKKGKKPPKVAGLRLQKGFPTVAIGRGQRLVAYADAACTHEGGGSVKEGALGVYVGAFPLSRVGDATTDGLGILTGEDSVRVGGEATPSKLA